MRFHSGWGYLHYMRQVVFITQVFGNNTNLLALSQHASLRPGSFYWAVWAPYYLKCTAFIKDTCNIRFLSALQFQLQMFDIVCSLGWTSRDRCCDLPSMVRKDLKNNLQIGIESTNVGLSSGSGRPMNQALVYAPRRTFDHCGETPDLGVALAVGTQSAPPKAVAPSCAIFSLSWNSRCFPCVPVDHISTWHETLLSVLAVVSSLPLFNCSSCLHRDRNRHSLSRVCVPHMSRDFCVAVIIPTTKQTWRICMR